MKCQKRTPVEAGNPLIDVHVKMIAQRKHREAIEQAQACVAYAYLVIGQYMAPFLEERRRARSEDMKMVEAITKTMNREFSISTRAGPTTLNLGRRKEELRLISRSNLKLLDRLERTRSEYSHRKLSKDYNQQQRYALNASFTLRKKCEAIAREVNSRNAGNDDYIAY